VKYDNIKAFEKHLAGAAPSYLAPLYAILSKDSPDSKEAIQILLHYLLPKEKDLALRTYDGSQLNADELLLELSSSSFFVSKKVIWIQQAEKLKKNIQESIESYLTNPHSSICLVLSALSISKTTSFYKNLEKVGVILELVEPKPWEKEKVLIDWVNKQAGAARKIMAYPVCQLMVKYSGNDAALLFQEWEKLLCYVGEKKDILQSDIEAICSRLPAYTVWQLGEAIMRGDGKGALAIGKYLLAEGQALLPLLRQIRSQLQTGYQICTILAQEDGQVAEVSQDFPNLKGQILERNLQLAQQYGLEKFKKGLLLLDETELQAKNSQIEDLLLAELLLIKLAGR
jgi:DNA polymerase-3 subunit delta